MKRLLGKSPVLPESSQEPAGDFLLGVCLEMQLQTKVKVGSTASCSCLCHGEQLSQGRGHCWGGQG